MTVAQEYADARLEHYKAQFGGDAHGKYTGNREVKKKLAAQWARLTREQQIEAAAAYFETTLQYERTRPR